MEPATIFYTQPNNTNIQKRKNYLIVKKIMSYEGRDYTFLDYCRQHGKKRDIYLTIKPKTKAEYDELMGMMNGENKLFVN